MDEIDRDLLRQTFELAEENNRMLRKMERMARINTAIRIAYWVIVIGAAIGLFYFLQPYIDMAKAIYSDFGTFVGS